MYYTGNRSVSLATNWIFDHPELDLETPLEEEIERLEAEEAEQELLGEEEEEEGEEDSEEEASALLHHHHLLHHHNGHLCHDEDESGHMHCNSSNHNYYEDSDVRHVTHVQLTH